MRVTAWLWLVGACLGGCCVPAHAAEPSGGAVRLSGTVRYAVPEKCLSPVRSLPTLKPATFTTDSGAMHPIVMDAWGAEFAVVMNRERVEVVGRLSRRGVDTWLTVDGYADPALSAAHELWRRMCCNNCAVSAALANAARPANLHGASPAVGRAYTRRDRVLCWARDRACLWLGFDNRVVQVSLDDRRVVATYGRRQGLPDALLHELHSDGQTLWLVHGGGVSALTPQGADMPQSRLACAFAHVCRTADGAWLVTDTGTFRLAGAAQAERVGPALPTASRIRRAVDDGIWQPHRRRGTGHFVAAAAQAAGRLYVASMGEAYELDGGAWRRIAKQAWALQGGAGRVWFVTAKGLTEYEPLSRETTVHTPPRMGRARYSHLVLTDAAAWLAAEPSAAGGAESAGGMARFDLAARTWQVWRVVDGERVNHVCAMQAADEALWAVNRTGVCRTLAADPGMLRVRRRVFDATAFSLLRFDRTAGEWRRLPLEQPEPESRLICGHDGSRGMAPILPQSVVGLCVGPHRIFGAVQLVPAGFFGGYWPCVSQLAERPESGPWADRFTHHTADLDLQGEQPAVLNISNSGRRVLAAVGHDEVLALFVHRGQHWALTEGCAAWFDESARRWVKVVEAETRFYWRATAGLDAGDYLYIGSDRGIVARLAPDTGLFEPLIALTDRSISRISRTSAGRLLVNSVPAPLGLLPAGLAARLKTVAWAAAEYDGERWREAHTQPPAPAGEPSWFFKQIERREPRDKSRGNFLWGPAPDAGEARPRYYVKEVFFPEFLCENAEHGRVWVSTFSGVARLDVGR
ncbi:MAG: hypothetical protein JXR37_03045 [Kiritimatiellae bacterium]|nr:hypothetical protein [Kiritimatiellia bacterium]